MTKHEYFRQFSLPDWDKREVPQGLGWYYTRYNPTTHEGEGWFGTEDKPEYSFEDKIFEGEDGEPVLMSRTCGIGEGCFWTEWR